ncbi:MAG TPA: NUDIX hydrolase [Mycobacteriales bacterium]|nr:NUDIX hydrolase [Mycobacteriales bacterium]
MSGEPADVDGSLVNLRCSVVVFRRDGVLLVERDAEYGGDWVLPGGNPRNGEGTAACARREAREETGLEVDPARVAFVLEASHRGSRLHTIEIVFFGKLADSSAEPSQQEPGLRPAFVPLADLTSLDLRPPLAGHLRALHARRGDEATAPYLGNVWRPRPATPDPAGRTSEG